MKIFIPIVAVLFTACKTVYVPNNISGTYYKEGKDYRYELILNTDSSFVLKQAYFEANATCQGKWRYLSNRTIFLKCNEEAFPAAIQKGYMSEREKNVHIISKNRIRINKVILKKR